MKVAAEAPARLVLLLAVAAAAAPLDCRSANLLLASSALPVGSAPLASFVPLAGFVLLAGFALLADSAPRASSAQLGGELVEPAGYAGIAGEPSSSGAAARYFAALCSAAL